MSGAKSPFSIKPTMLCPCWRRMVYAYDGCNRVYVVNGMVCFANVVSRRSAETERSP